MGNHKKKVFKPAFCNDVGIGRNRHLKAKAASASGEFGQSAEHVLAEEGQNNKDTTITLKLPEAVEVRNAKLTTYIQPTRSDLGLD